jgi:hypothetical protein
MAHDKLIDSAKLDGAMTATADAIRGKTGKTADIPWDESTGFASEIASITTETEPNLQAKTATPSTSAQTIKPDSGYDGLSQVTVNAMPTATQATPTISVSSAGLITAAATQTAGYVAAGTKSATKQLTTQAAKTVTPSTSNQTAVASGRYTTGAVTVKGDANLKAANIAKGVSIFGVTGTLASGAKIATGTFSPQSHNISSEDGYPITVTGLGFKPSFIFFYLDVPPNEYSYEDWYQGNRWSHYFSEEYYVVCGFTDGTTVRTFAPTYGWEEDEDTGEEWVEAGITLFDTLQVTMNNDGFTFKQHYGQPMYQDWNYSYRYYAIA